MAVELKGPIVIPAVLRWKQLAIRYGNIFKIGPSLISAFIRKESTGDPKAYQYEPNFWEKYLKDNPRWQKEDSRKISASYGLMQPLYITCWEYGFYGKPEDLYQPEASVYWGCRILVAKMEKYCDNIKAAISAYNAGVALYSGGRIGKNDQLLCEDTFINQGYVDDVLKCWEAYAKIF